LKALAARCNRTAESLAAAEEQDRTFRLGRDFADDEDGQGFQQVEMAQRVTERPDTGRSSARQAVPAVPGEARSVGRDRDVRNGAAVSMRPLQMLTNLVMYTLVWIPAGVKAGTDHAKKER